MGYKMRYYEEKDFDQIEELVLKSYEWDVPIFGLSRLEFSKGFHPAYLNCKDNWRHMVGIFEEEDKIVACVINECSYDGDAFFLFDSKERGKDTDLLEKMFFHAKTQMSCFNKETRERYINLRIPTWNKELRDFAIKEGFVKEEWTEPTYIMSFEDEPYKVTIPEGYKIVDGTTTPNFFLANVHRQAFWYELPCAETGEQAFHDLRKMKHYNPKLDLCMIDPEGRPVGMAIIWYDEKMPYCELEPLGVVWWDRRKKIASNLLYEAANRVREYGNCMGMTGGNQQFYYDLGFELKGESEIYCWKQRIKQSWE